MTIEEKIDFLKTIMTDEDLDRLEKLINKIDETDYESNKFKRLYLLMGVDKEAANLIDEMMEDYGRKLYAQGILACAKMLEEPEKFEKDDFGRMINKIERDVEKMFEKKTIEQIKKEVYRLHISMAIFSRKRFKIKEVAKHMWESSRK